MSTVTIGCKLPNGIWMQSGDSKPVRIYGWNANKVLGNDIGVTDNVPAALWEAWSKEHADSKLVKGGFIYAVKNEKEAKAKAKDVGKSGHEGLDQVKATDKAGVLGKSDDK